MRKHQLKGGPGRDLQGFYRFTFITITIVVAFSFVVGCAPREDRVVYEEDFCMETSGWDSDGDGIFNECDSCPLVADPSNLDSDQDDWGDVCDPCPYDRFDRCQEASADGDGDSDSDGDTDSDGDSDGDGDGDTDGDSDGDTGPRDHDGDGYSSSIDCDDADSTIYPGASERCNGLDDDCDGVVDEGCERDLDRDSDGFTVAEGDCNDTNPSIYPGAPERCNEVDNDCDGVVDEGCPVDSDRDGFTSVEGDCDDFDSDVHPGAPELCDGDDNDCDGVVDEGCDDSCPECPPTDPEPEPECPDLTVSREGDEVVLRGFRATDFQVMEFWTDDARSNDWVSGIRSGFSVRFPIPMDTGFDWFIPYTGTGSSSRGSVLHVPDPEECVTFISGTYLCGSSGAGSCPSLLPCHMGGAPCP